MLACLMSAWAGCGGDGSDDAGSPTGPSATQGDVTLRVTQVGGTRGSSNSGLLAYVVQYTVENGADYPLETSIDGYSLFGPNGELLDPKRSYMPTLGLHVPAKSTRTERTTLYDSNLANPWATRLSVRLSYPGPGGNTRTLTAGSSVVAGPPIPRVLQFSALPLTPRVGDPVTVQWAVTGASRVRLSYWVATPTAISGPTNVDVEPSGSRTVVIQERTRRSVSLVVDDWIGESILIDSTGL